MVLSGGIPPLRTVFRIAKWRSKWRWAKNKTSDFYVCGWSSQSLIAVESFERLQIALASDTGMLQSARLCLQLVSGICSG